MILLRIVLRGMGFVLLLMIIGMVLSGFSFATGHKEPMGLLGVIINFIVILLETPTFWIKPPFDLLKNLTKIIMTILFWGVVFNYFPVLIAKFKKKD